MDDSVTYNTLKEKLILMDKNSRVWSGSYLKLVQNSIKNDPNGPAPMDVDSINYVGSKGQQKGKQKGKGKKGGWFPFGYGGKSAGKSTKGKGKQKGKGKKGKKGKSKAFGGGKGKGGQDRNACRVCGQQGHWGNECPNKAQTVTNVTAPSVVESEIASSAGGKARAAGSGSSVASTATTGTRPQVRQVRMYHVATPRDELSTPVMYDIKSDGGDSWLYDDQYQVNVVSFVLDEGDSEAEEMQPGQLDRTAPWYMDITARRYIVGGELPEMDETLRICAVQEVNQKSLIVWDSGADISILPQNMAACGRRGFPGKAVLQDARGRLRTFGKKVAQVECEGVHETVPIEDEFVIASVQTPLISLGRLLQRGWSMVPGDGEAGVHLQAPDKECQIPLCFKKNSLAVLGVIRRVSHEPGQLQGGEGSIQRRDDDEVLVVQTVVKLHDKFWDNYGYRAWKTTPEGNPVKFSYETKHYVDGQLIWNLNWWPLRSTLIRKPDDTWELVEHCNQYYTGEPDGEIIECQGVETQTLTVLHRRKEPLNFFGSVVGEQTVTAGGALADSDDFQFTDEPTVPFELHPSNEVHVEEVDQMDIGGDWDGPMPWFENKETLVVNGNELNEQSSLASLREAAEFLGLGRGGSKYTLWTRLNQEVQKIEQRDMFVVANRLFKEQNRHKGLIAIRAPRQPSKEEKELHELTHVPYRDWCDFCVACKGKSDVQRQLDKSEEGRRSIPGIQYWTTPLGDLSRKDGQEDLVVVLVGVDAETRMVLSVPVESKGADLRGQAEHVVRFSLSLNHYGNTEIIGGSEPTMKSLLTYIKSIRHGLGLETTITKSMKKGQTGRVERAIATLRKQASTLMEMAEDRCCLNLEGSHPLWYWAYLHAAWLLNRFGVHSALDSTPFEMAVLWEACVLW